MNKKPKNKMTPKQTMFCKEYLVDLNATSAAVRAGYSKKTAEQQGCRLLRNVKVAAYIQKHMDKRSQKIEITAEYVLNNIKEIGERCMQRVPVMVKDGKNWKQKTEINDDGEEVGVWEFKEMGALKAQDLLGRHLNLFEDKEDKPITINLNYGHRRNWKREEE